MAGKTSSQAITEYAGIQVQTSALGVQIAVGWGTFRCSCNLMDYLDFNAKAQKASNKGGGKGGQATTGYSYSATLILSICEGPIDGVGIVYVDSSIYTDGAKTALQQANLNMNTGAVGQAVWSYLTSNHPDHAIGYSGLAIAYQSNYPLTAGATPPNHSFEVKRLTSFGVSGSKDADPSLVIADFFQNTRTGVPSWTNGLLGSLTQYQNYCLAAGLLLSPVIDQQRSASDFLTEVMLATNSTCVWSEGVLKFIPYGDTALSGNGKTYTPNNTPIYALNDDDYVVDASGDAPLQVDIEDQSDAYNVIQLEYLDRTNQYNMAIALASDAANVAQYGMRRQDPTTSHVICDPGVAAIAAQLYLQRTLYIRAQYRFKVGWMFALLEPGDIIALNDAGLGLSSYPVRVIQIDQDEQYGLSFTCEDYPVGVSHTPLYQMQNAVGYVVNKTIDPGGVEANLLLWSDDLTQSANWGLNNASIVGNVANDQYGLTTADALVVTATNAGHFVYQSFNVFAGLNYTASVCLQKNAHKCARVYLVDAGFVDGVYVDVDLNAGVILDGPYALGTGVLVSGVMTASLVSGIWQITLTAQVPGQTSLYLVIFALSDSGALNWLGDGSQAINISQPQVRQGVAAGVYAATQSGIACAHLFNPPSVLASGNANELWAAVAGGPNWGGCNVWVSVDGASYQQVGVLNGSSRYGVTTSALPSSTDPDTTHSVAIDLGMSGGELTGASQATADNGGTMCLIDGELITYEAATLTNPSRYTLGTYLRRGFSNTTIAAHAPNVPFVRIDDNIFQFPYLNVSVGATIYVKFQSFNAFGEAVVDLSDCLAYSVVPFPAGSATPASGAWTAVGGELTSGTQTVPAIEITGASDNPAAQGIIFYYRLHGATAWNSAGLHPNSTTLLNITSVNASAYYDVGVAYQVNGVIGQIATIASNIQAGPAVFPNQAPAATDSSIQAGATKNVITYSATAPGSPTSDDIWVDTSFSPAQVFIRFSGAWVSVANLTSNTNQLTDGANLGETALWASIASTPANLTALTGAEAIQNSILSAALTGGSVVPAQAGTITGQAAAATDGSIQTGATFNPFFVQTADPTIANPTLADGAIWYNPTTGVEVKRFGGAWIATNSPADGSIVFNKSHPASNASWSYTVKSTDLPFMTVAAVGAGGGTNTGGAYDGGSGGTVVWHGVVSAGDVISGSVGATGANHPTSTGGGGGGTTATTTGATSFSLNAGGGGGGSGSANGAGGTATGGGGTGGSNTPGISGGGPNSGSITLTGHTS